MLKQIRYFHIVVRCNSFTRAAMECHISQSAVSQQIRTLERKLGVTLLRRENRTFTLTPAGAYFYQNSLKFLNEFDHYCAETRRIGLNEGSEGLQPEKAAAQEGSGGDSSET